MSDLHFDYEFIFTSGCFDQDIYNQCTIPDTTGTRLQDIENLIIKIQEICKEVPGLHIFSTFFKEDPHMFKITVNNTNWVNK